jgi:hypothetical protein
MSVFKLAWPKKVECDDEVPISDTAKIYMYLNLIEKDAFYFLIVILE